MITISIPTATDFWAAFTRFGYRRWAATMTPGEKPHGVPGNRDPKAPCSAYAPRPLRLGEWADCDTDGHYLCDECCHRAASTMRDQDMELERET